MINQEKSGILGIDPGEKRIGLAIAHRGISVAAGLGVIEFTGKRMIIERLGAIMAEENVGLVVMGLPINMDGTEGESAKKARRLAELINKELSIPVEFIDERLTTEQAQRLIRETGKKVGKDKGAVDIIAAVTLLQCYMDMTTK